MDDFIKILIWAIIIITFFSSFFKKKNKGDQKSQPPQRGNDNVMTGNTQKIESIPKSAQSKEEIDSYNDMLSEIESLFKKDDELKVKISDKTRIESHEANKASAQNEIQWHKGTDSEHTLITDWEKDEKNLEKKAVIDFNIENKAKKFEEVINKKSEPIGLFRHSIKEKLNHPETLKDYILMSEIIGKPKAKRR